MTNPTIIIVDSVTRLGADAAGRVAIAASHGGVYAGYLAAKSGVRGVILHDAAVGKDDAGIGALPYLERLGIPAATVNYSSARIGNGNSLAEHGVISFVNASAAKLGCAAGQKCIDCAETLLGAARVAAKPPAYAEARFVIRRNTGEPVVMGCDSVSLVQPEDAGAIVITASHGDVLATDPQWGNRPDVLAAVFCDAGSTTVSRLPNLDSRGIAAATVSATSARIGDAQSVYDDGVISHLNDTAAALGAAAGMTTMAFVDLVIETAS